MLITIRTADRAPKRNYLGHTVTQLYTHGVQPWEIHLFPTDPDVRWLDRELGHVAWCTPDDPSLPHIRVHAPTQRIGPNANGVRQVSALDHAEADWLLMLEDDVDVCADFPGSVSRWLADYMDPAFHVYRCHALPNSPLRRVGAFAAVAPLREMKGSQAVILRADDARAFAAWATAHPTDWRPKGAPFQDRPDRGFDKLVGYWALQQWPDQPNGLVSLPMLVNHVGRESALHSHGLRNDAHFAGASWRYPVQVSA